MASITRASELHAWDLFMASSHNLLMAYLSLELVSLTSTF